MDEKNKLVIRKKSSFPALLRRAIFLIILWAITIFIIYVNFSFIFKAYSDTLVSLYLLFNLSFHIYKILGEVIIFSGLVISVFGIIHIRNLRRKDLNHEKDNS